VCSTTSSGRAAIWPADERLAEAATSAAGQGPVPLADQLGEPALLVEVLLEQWAHERRVVYSKAPGRRFRIHKILPVPS
jgi:hypothetical protein